MRIATAIGVEPHAGSIPWTINRPYFDLRPASGPYPLHAHYVTITSDWLERGECQRLGPNMVMTPVFRQILITEAGMPEYQADCLAGLPSALRSPAWDNAAELSQRASDLTGWQRIAVGRVLVALTFYGEALRVLRAAPAADPATDPASATLIAETLAAQYVTGEGGRADLEKEIVAALRILPGGRVPAIAVRLLQAALFARRHRARAEVDEICAPLHAEVESARPTLSVDDWYRLRARVCAMHAKLLAEADPAASARMLREAEECLLALDADHDPLFREARRRLLDRRCLAAQRTGDLHQAEAAAAESVRIDPMCSKAWLQLGNVQTASGDDELALRSYRRAAALGPLFTAMAHYLSGQMLDRLDQRDEALHEYLRAARLDPASSSVADALATDARLLGDRLAGDVAARLRQAQRRPGMPMSRAAS